MAEMNTRNRPIKDVRFFSTSRVPLAGEPIFSDAKAIVPLPPKVHRLGQRIACLLESKAFSIAPADHLYLSVTPSLGAGDVVAIGSGFDKWQWYAACGLPEGYGALPLTQKLKYFQNAVFEALNRIAPQQSSILEVAQRQLAEDGPLTRIQRAVKETAGYRFEAWFDDPCLRAHILLPASPHQPASRSRRSVSRLLHRNLLARTCQKALLLRRPAIGRLRSTFSPAPRVPPRAVNFISVHYPLRVPFPHATCAIGMRRLGQI